MAQKDLNDLMANMVYFYHRLEWILRCLRGEAMSCGLVPVTSNVCAIPEFVTPKCGFINNYHEIANAIEILYLNPTMFKENLIILLEYIKS